METLESAEFCIDSLIFTSPLIVPLCLMLDLAEKACSSTTPLKIFLLHEDGNERNAADITKRDRQSMRSEFGLPGEEIGLGSHYESAKKHGDCDSAPGQSQGFGLVELVGAQASRPPQSPGADEYQPGGYKFGDRNDGPGGPDSDGMFNSLPVSQSFDILRVQHRGDRVESAVYLDEVPNSANQRPQSDQQQKHDFCNSEHGLSLPVIELIALIWRILN